jgi:glycerate 2-kinase
MDSHLRAKRRSGWPAAASADVRVVAVAGRLQLSPAQLREAGISAAYTLTDLEPDLNRCIANASPLLRSVGAQIAKDWPA